MTHEFHLEAGGGRVWLAAWRLLHAGTIFQSNNLAPLRLEVGSRKLARAGDDGGSETFESRRSIRSNVISTLLFMGRRDQALPLIDEDVAELRASGTDPASLANALCRRAGMEDDESKQALEWVREAVSVAKLALKANPTDDHLLLVSHVCGSALAQRLEHERPACAILAYRRLAREARAEPLRRQGAHAAGPLLAAAVRMSAKWPSKALPLAREALAAYTDLADQDPDAWNHRRAAALRDTANLLLLAGHADEARANLAEGVRLFRELREVNERHYGEDLARTLLMRARLFPDAPEVEADLLDAIATFHTTGRITEGSATACGVLASRWMALRDPRGPAAALLATFQILLFATSTEHSTRLALLLAVPGFGMAIDPSPASPLHQVTFPIAEAAGIASGADTEAATARLAALPPAVLNQMVHDCIRTLIAPFGEPKIPADVESARQMVDQLRARWAPTATNEETEHRINALFEQASRARRAGRLELALEKYDEALHEPLPLQAVGATWFNKGGTLMQLGRPADAEAAFLQALCSAMPEELVEPTYANLFVLLHDDPQRWQEALACMRRATRAAPESALLWAHFAWILYYTDRYRAAMVAAARALSLGADRSTAGPILVQARSEAGRMQELFGQAKSEMESRPRVLKGWRMAIVALLNLEALEQAEQLCLEALAKNPSWHAIECLRASIWLAKGQCDEALNAAERALTTAPESGEAMAMKTLVLKVRGYEERLGERGREA